MKIPFSFIQSGSKYLLPALCLLVSQHSLAQNYNNIYPESFTIPISGGGPRSMVEYTNGNTALAVVGTRHEDSQSDVQLTFIKPSGLPEVAYRYGDLQGSETGSGICEIQGAPGEFLLCGRSKNNRVLVMRVKKTNGTVAWAKEIDFPYASESGVNIIPVAAFGNIPAGYVVVGFGETNATVGGVVAAKLDASGNMLWAKAYNATTSIKAVMTDAIARPSTNHEILSISGYLVGNGTFFMNIRSGDGAIFMNSGSRYSIGMNPRMTEFTSGGTTKVAIAMISPPSDGVFTLAINGYSAFTPIWGKQHLLPPAYYGNTGLVEDNVFSMANLPNTTHLGILKNHWDAPDQASPTMLTLDYNGIALTEERYSRIDHPYCLPVSMIHSSNLGYPAFTGSVIEDPLTNTPQILHVVREQNNLSPDAICKEPLTVTTTAVNIGTSALNMTASDVGVITSYSVVLTSVSIGGLNCYDGSLRPVATTATDPEATSGTSWFSPNPAKNSLTLDLGNTQHTVTLYSLTGSVVLRQTVTGQQTLSLEGIAPGAYHLEKTDAQGLSTRRILIVQE